MSSTPAAAGSWKRYSPDPRLALRPGKFDSEHIHAPMVVEENGRYRMWYSGSDRERNEFHRIGYAESPDGLDWEPMDDPLLVPQDLDGYYTTPAILRDPAGEVLKQDGLYKMWFTGHNLMCDLHLATSPDGFKWRIGEPETLSTEVYCPTVLFEDGPVSRPRQQLGEPLLLQSQRDRRAGWQGQALLRLPQRHDSQVLRHRPGHPGGVRWASASARRRLGQVRLGATSVQLVVSGCTVVSLRQSKVDITHVLWLNPASLGPGFGARSDAVTEAVAATEEHCCRRLRSAGGIARIP